MVKRSAKAGINIVSGFGLNVFSGDEVRTLHYATLEILHDLGIKVVSEEALEIFHGAGALVERCEGYGLVKIPN